MADLNVEKIRNVAVIAHGGAGKTSLVEAILYATKKIDRMGRVEDGNTVTDWEPEEIARQISISSSATGTDWKGHSLGFIDTPGYMNFLEDTRAALSAVDGAVLVVSALPGIKAETQKVWQYANDAGVPRIVFVNHMDKENADYETALDGVETMYGTKAFPLYMPVGSGEGFKGVVDLLAMKMMTFTDGGATTADIPDDLKDEVEDFRNRMVERVAESNDDLLEKYLEGEELGDDELKSAVREACLSCEFVPVVCGSATRNKGTEALLDAIVLCLPSPIDRAAAAPIVGVNPKDDSEARREPSPTAPLVAQVFKTIADPFAGKLTVFRVYAGTFKADSTVYNATKGTKERVGSLLLLNGKEHTSVNEIGPGGIGAVAKLKETQTGDTLCAESDPIKLSAIKFADPVISFAIEPKSRGDEEKVAMGLHRLLEEDPTLRFHRDEETKEMILGGMGQMHLEVTLERLKRKFGAEVIMKTPKIPYRETIRKTSKAQGRYKKQSGGRGQFGDCHIELEPMPRGGGFEFVNAIVGGAIPRQYIPAVEKGIYEAAKEGVLAGYPTVDFKVTLYDGSFHAVDSSEMAFKIAGSMAFKKAAPEAGPVLLEPVMNVETVTPDDCLGDVIGDLNSKRGKVQGMEQQAGETQKVMAQVPMSELLTYANDLNSITSGRAMYTMEFSHYEEVPGNIAQKIIEARAKERGKDEE